MTPTLTVWTALHQRLRLMQGAGRLDKDDHLALLDIARDVRSLEVFANAIVVADRDREAAMASGSNILPFRRLA